MKNFFRLWGDWLWFFGILGTLWLVVEVGGHIRAVRAQKDSGWRIGPIDTNRFPITNAVSVIPGGGAWVVYHTNDTNLAGAVAETQRILGHE